ncbi:hypothetical protein [Acinetobacter sp. ANC 4177]|jgi:hypothetical protein|uniref:hypothetical protein n=1 Tax=Acinetobacter sp. ANC 4177 TaxID=2529838 RepID=UPI00103ADD34|nr:hypothetical protein [Acinetobacter sp. ANC 4177]TCB73909.1 hypothetical protein E0H91_10925 [Acinetobacter sp. ANC 4177]
MKKVLIIALLVGLTGCGKSEAEKARHVSEMKELRYNQMAEEFVKSHLKDPDSAQFRGQQGFCGEVNSKNSFGAYTGFKKFIAADKNMIVMEDDLSPQEFQKVWDGVCK